MAPGVTKNLQKHRSSNLQRQLEDRDEAQSRHAPRKAAHVKQKKAVKKLGKIYYDLSECRGSEVRQ